MVIRKQIALSIEDIREELVSDDVKSIHGNSNDIQRRFTTGCPRIKFTSCTQYYKEWKSLFAGTSRAGQRNFL